ncbi:unnamed protein product [Ectocarpus sp. 8 AP-2014]
MTTNVCPWDERTCSEAAKGGHLERLQWARENGCTFPRSAVIEQARPSKGQPFARVHRKFSRCSPQAAPAPATCAQAARGAHVDILKWLRAQGCGWDEYHTGAAPSDVIRGCWNGRRHPPRTGRQGCGTRTRALGDERTCAGAALGGCDDILEWLRRHLCPELGFKVARRGDVGMILWRPRHQGRLWVRIDHVGACAGVPRGGHLEVLQWMRTNVCPWDERTCSEAAKGGHLER